MEIQNKKIEDWSMSKGMKIIFGIVGIVVPMVLTWGVYYRSSYYVMEYYLGISKSEFWPIRILFSIGTGVAVGVPSFLVLAGIFRIYLRLTRNKGPFDRRDWLMIINVSSTLFTIPIAYGAFEFYFFHHPAPYFQQVVETFYGCTLTVFIVCVGGGILAEKIQNKMGEKASR